jgi:UDP-N-acetylmuramoyl-tripeptide--D-alanyl-D-alanine ligase
MPLKMPLSQIAALLKAELPLHIIVSGVSVDSRLLKPGDLFFALPGERVDGHSYLKEAAVKGAVGAVVQEDYRGDSLGLPLIRVDDGLKALQTLAKKELQSRKTRIVAVTGSVGKTTTKEFMATLLSDRYRVAKSPGNSNSKIGLPLTILNHTHGDEEILVLEMGMTHPGQISELIEIAPPDIALITTVALAHAMNFSSLEEIAKAKAEIFLHPQTAIGFYPEIMSCYPWISGIGTCEKKKFTREKITLQLPGDHNHHNFSAACAVARYLGLSDDEILSKVPELKLPKLRMQTVEKKGVTFVNDAYNACEASMKASLSSLPKIFGRKIGILGQMGELGKFSEMCHRNVGEFALNHLDHLLCYGPSCLPIQEVWGQAGRHVEIFPTHEALVEALRTVVKPGDLVLLKGSRSTQLERILELF